MQYGSLSNHLCQTEEEKITAYNLRYQAYTTVGYNQTCTRGLYTDKHDEASNNFTFLLKENGKSIGTTRVSVFHRPFGWIDVPCKGGFEQEFEALEKQYDAIIEVGRLAVLPDLRGLDSIAPQALQCNVFAIGERFGRTAIVCASGKRHMRYYQRLGMESICGFAPRPNAAIDLTLMVREVNFDDHLLACGMDEQTGRSLVPKLPNDFFDQYQYSECVA